jgi:hypothetical protein
MPAIIKSKHDAAKHTARHLGLGRRDIDRAGRSHENKGAIRTTAAEPAVI